MDRFNIAGVIISIISALGALAASRAASKASTGNARTEAEKEAYDRARKMDVETIERQDKEIDEIREQNKLLKEQNDHLNADVKRIDSDNRSLHDENRRVMEDNARLRAELRAMRLRLVRIERGINPDSTEPVVERREDIPPWGDGDEFDEVNSDLPTAPPNAEPYLDLRGDVDDGQEPPER